MAEVIYTFRPAAQAAIDARKAELLRQRRLGLISSDYVRRELRAFVDREMWSAQHATGEDALIGVRCPSCAREHIMPGDVKAYRCKCDPNRERPTFVNRFALT
jgi:hypothetical protein